MFAACIPMLLGCSFCFAQDPDAKIGTVKIYEKMTLEQAVEKLNNLSKDHTIGSNQSPLTADEIVGAITRWSGKPPIPDEKRAEFETIAKTRMLNLGDQLQFSTSFQSDGNYFTVWWLDLTVGRYKFRIRDRTISSRPQTDEEKAMPEKRLKRMQELLKQRGRENKAGG